MSRPDERAWHWRDPALVLAPETARVVWDRTVERAASLGAAVLDGRLTTFWVRPSPGDEPVGAVRVRWAVPSRDAATVERVTWNPTAASEATVWAALERAVGRPIPR